MAKLEVGTKDTDEADSMEALFEHAPDLYCIANAGGELLRVNAAFETLGYARGELRSRHLLELVHLDDVALTITACAKLETVGSRSRCDNRIRCKDGSYRRITWTCSRSSSGSLIAIGRDRDAADARGTIHHLHDELDRQRHQYQSIFDTLPQMVWLKDEKNTILRANVAGARSVGLAPHEVEGLSEWEFHPRQADLYHRDDLEVIREGKPKRDIIEPYEPSPGDVHWLRTDKIPYRNASGEVLGVVVCATDVTAWKRCEEERARIYEQLKRLDGLKSRFFANVSHELRTPLTLLLGPVDKLLATGGLGEDARRDLEVVRRNGRILLRHVNDLLDIAKIDSGQMHLELSLVDLSELVRVTADPFESIARDRCITVAVESASAPHACVDVEKLQRVIGNLLSNAFRFTPNGGTIRCRVSEEEAGAGEAVIEVSDSGRGIEPSMREAIFERFRQAGDVAIRGGGTGLGLAIAKELVSLHQGRIEAGAAPEGGAKFTIRLPRNLRPNDGTGSEVRELGRAGAWNAADADLAATPFTAALTIDPHDRRGEASALAFDAPGDERPLVLVVDDSVEMNRFVSRELSTDYRVVCAFDGEEALRVARATKPDLVLTDLVMPRSDGIDLLRSLRADEELKTIPVVLLTAHADENTTVRALEEGADDYLIKPFSSPELQARVRSHMKLVRTRRDVVLCEEEAIHLRKAIHARDAFLGLAPHELRTPLSTLQLNLQVLERLGPDAEPMRRERLAVAMRACRQMSGLVDMLLDVARVATGHMKLEKVELDFAVLIRELAGRFQSEASASGSTLELKMGGPAVGVWDRSRVEQVLSNLLANAIKFGMGKPIELGYTVDPDCVHVRVQDHGIGITPEDQSRIFQRFEDAILPRSRGGLGLGLWIANDIVCRHDGAIHLASKPGAGSTITIDLPRASKR